MPLETEARAEIRSLVADLLPNDGKLLTALHRVQHRYGYISREAMEVVAEQLEMFPAHVYGAASFYEEYRFDPPPRTAIRWCTGPACRLRNANGIRDAMLATLGLSEVGEQTEDGGCGLVFGQCNGSCEQAPMVWIEDNVEHTRHVHGKLTAASAIKLARAIRDGESIEGGTKLSSSADVQAKFEAIRDNATAVYDAWRKPERPRIDVAIDTSSLANGAAETQAQIAALIDERNAVADVGRNHGYGIQWLHPLVTITWPDGTSVLYGPVTPEDAAAIVDEATGAASHASRLAIGTIFGERPGVRPIREHPFFANEPAERRIMSNIGLTDPESFEHYVGTGGWAALARVLYRGQQPESVRQELIDAAVTGRGGASFPAGVKWNFLAGAPGDEHYMVCNADEGDPGAWVNRVILEGDPHLLVEGMTIGAFATGSKRGFIYIREEYPLGVERTEQAIRQAEEAGLLGDNILGTDFSFKLEVVKGAGAYVCGEETGLLSSIQDSRGMPRVKPPFPAQAGVFMKPSNVNNVETYANAPFVMRHGHEWYLQEGTEQMRGTRIFSFSGDVPYAGFMELPFGTPLAKVLEACGGITKGELKAIQSGGPLGSFVPASALPTLELQNSSFAPYDAIMGAGGIVWVSDQTSLVILNEMFSWFVEEESCGRCTTCHGGNQRQTEIFRRILDGNGRRDDYVNLKLIDATLQSSNCVHGQFSPKIMRNLLQHFRDDYDALALERRDPTLTVPAMTSFRVANSRDPKVEDAVAICPVDAFRGTPGNRTIDDDACIRCGACTDLAPGAIVREPKALGSAAIPVVAAPR